MNNQYPKVSLVIPTIRNLDFLKEWGDEFSKCNLIIVEDGPKRTVRTGGLQIDSLYHFCWQNIDEDFGENNWIFSRKNAGIRSYGFWKAYQMAAEVIVTIDDDCYPVENSYINRHLDNLSFMAADEWYPTYPNPRWMYTRGFPYKIREKSLVMVSHGLWSGALDLDAETEILLKKPLDEKVYPPIRQIIPKNHFYPMCSMNLAFRRTVVPLMFFPMMGFDPDDKPWGFDRYDDIWAGILSKHIMDHLNMKVINGSPFVEHRKASILKENIKKEKAGKKINEDIWKRVGGVKLSKTNPSECYKELARKIKFPKKKYFHHLKKAMILWANLF